MREPDGGGLDDERPGYPDPREEDIAYGDRRLSRPDASVPDWEVPDTSYRPIPIVWFTGAMIVQLLILTAIAILATPISGYLAIALAALASGAVLGWTWDRGMREASVIWKAACLTIMTAQLALVCLAATLNL